MIHLLCKSCGDEQSASKFSTMREGRRSAVRPENNVDPTLLLGGGTVACRAEAEQSAITYCGQMGSTPNLFRFETPVGSLKTHGTHELSRSGSGDSPSISLPIPPQAPICLANPLAPGLLSLFFVLRGGPRARQIIRSRNELYVKG